MNSINQSALPEHGKPAKKMKQINPNIKTNLSTLKSVLEDSRITEEDGKKVLLFNPEHFRGFRWLLTKVASHFSCTEEAGKYLEEYFQENEIKSYGFISIPDWAK